MYAQRTRIKYLLQLNWRCGNLTKSKEKKHSAFKWNSCKHMSSGNGKMQRNNNNNKRRIKTGKGVKSEIKKFVQFAHRLSRVVQAKEDGEKSYTSEIARYNRRVDGPLRQSTLNDHHHAKMRLMQCVAVSRLLLHSFFFVQRSRNDLAHCQSRLLLHSWVTRLFGAENDILRTPRKCKSQPQQKATQKFQHQFCVPSSNVLVRCLLPIPKKMWIIFYLFAETQASRAQTRSIIPNSFIIRISLFLTHAF